MLDLLSAALVNMPWPMEWKRSWILYEGDVIAGTRRQKLLGFRSANEQTIRLYYLHKQMLFYHNHRYYRRPSSQSRRSLRS
jgi:hypothetical protein